MEVQMSYKNEKTIGERIRDLRKKHDLTQEKLADYLGVSYQAVSKWECNLTSPDLGLIGPLTKLLGVTSDELLGLTEKENDERKAYFDAAYQESMSRPTDENDYILAKQAVAEYPRELCYLYWLAHMEFFDAYENGLDKQDKTYFEKQLEQSLTHARMVYESTEDEKLRGSALHNIVLTLRYLERYDEACKYAEQGSTINTNVTYENLMELAMPEGDEKRAFKQKRRLSLYEDFLRNLNMVWSYGNIYSPESSFALDAAESIVQALFPDGNLLWSHCVVSDINATRAMSAAINGNREKSLDYLSKAANHAKAYDALFDGEKHSYTSPLFSLCTIEYAPLDPHFTNQKHEVLEKMNKPVFDFLRDDTDFQAITDSIKT